MKYYKTLVFILLISALSLFPFEKESLNPLFNIPHLDKFIHFAMYFCLSIIFFFEIKTSIDKVNIRKIIIYFFLIALLFSGILEIIQAFLIPGRLGSFMDLLANGTGLIFGIISFKFLTYKKSNL